MDLKCCDLKEFLKKNELSLYGNKQELIERIIQFFLNKENNVKVKQENDSKVNEKNNVKVNEENNIKVNEENDEDDLKIEKNNKRKRKINEQTTSKINKKNDSKKKKQKKKKNEKKRKKNIQKTDNEILYIDIFGEDNEHLIDLETIFLKNTKFNKIYSNNSFNFLNEDKINFEEINVKIKLNSNLNLNSNFKNTLKNITKKEISDIKNNNFLNDNVIYKIKN